MKTSTGLLLALIKSGDDLITESNEREVVDLKYQVYCVMGNLVVLSQIVASIICPNEIRQQTESKADNNVCLSTIMLGLLTVLKIRNYVADAAVSLGFGIRSLANFL